MVGVSGFEPEASWTRTKRDTKLRHTPLTSAIIVKFSLLVKGRFPMYAKAYLPYTVTGGDVRELLC